MNDAHSSGQPVPGRWSAVFFFGLVAAGAAANCFPIYIVNGQFIFGSVFAMLVLQFFGPGRAVAAAAGIAAVTWVRWNHPWALFTMTAEVALAGWLFRRRRMNLAAADALYWLVAGIPLGYVCYHWLGAFPAVSSLFILTKQALNGVANALLARLMFTLLILIRRKGETFSFQEIIANLVLFFTLATALVLLALGGRADLAATDQEIRTILAGENRQLADNLSNWLEERKRPLVHLADLASSLSPESMQKRLEEVRTTDLHFRRLALLDPKGTVIAYSPLLDALGRSNIGKSYADRAHIPALRKHLRPMLSAVVISRFGRSEPVAVLLAPVLTDGRYSGAVGGVLSFERLRNILQINAAGHDSFFTLVDKNNNVILTNREDLQVMSPFSHGPGKLKEEDGGIVRWIPDLPPNVSTIELWGQSRYVLDAAVGSLSEWRLVLEQPVAPYQKKLYARYTRAFSIVFAVFFTVLVLAEFLSRRIMASFRLLSRMAHDFPARLAAGERIAWPDSIIAESRDLVGHFREMADLLTAQFNDIRRMNDNLEEEVRARTAALRKSESQLTTAMEMARLGHWEYDVGEDRFTFNDRFYQIFGVKAEDVGGYRMSSADYARRFVHPDDRGMVGEEIGKAIETTDLRFRRQLEHRSLRADGTIGHIAVYFSVIKDSDGKTVATYGLNQDITERKQAEEQLRSVQAETRRLLAQTEQSRRALLSILEDRKATEEALRESYYLLANLAEQVPGVVYQYRLYPDGRSCFPYASTGMNEIYEVTPEEVREDATPVFGRLHPDDHDLIVGAIMESARTLELFHIEFRVILPRQGLRWRSSNAKPVRMDDGGTLWHGIIYDITERKTAEEKLAHSHDLMRYIIEHNRSAVAIHDKDLNYIYVSKRYLEDYKIGEPDIVGKHHYEVFPDLPQKWRDVHRKALNGQVSTADEDPFVREDGSVDWTRWECRPWYESDGSIGGIIVYTEVITERKQAEEKLRLLAGQYASILKTTQDGYWLTDTQGHLLEVNDTYSRMVGFSRDHLLSRHLSETEAVETPEIARRHIADIMSAGYGRFESRHRTSDGGVIDVEVSTSYWKEGDRFIVFIRDISERKKAAEALRESEQRFRSFVENVSDMIYSLTPEGLFTYVSPNWHHFMGESCDEALGRSFEGYVHPDDLLLCRDFLKRVLERREKQGSVEYRVRRRDGVWRWHTSTGSPLRNEAGEVISYVGVARDITEKKAMQEVMVQTEKIMSLGTMAAGMAHEINNPLGIISQGVQNVLRRTRDPLPANLQEAEKCRISFENLGRYLAGRNVFRSLEAVQEAVDRSAAIVANMLEFSRHSNASPVSCDINLILEKSVLLAGTDYDLKKKYDFRNIRIEKELSLQTEVPCLASELEQVFLNLLRNSAQCFREARQKEPLISLKTRTEGDWAVVEVEDNGTGIPEEIRKNIFDPFFTTKKAGEGTGLGLAVSYHIIVQRHQGQMTVESEAGQWTRFLIKLPLKVKKSF
ncbi:MAG: PAS domain S-box protein [Deltaproteobacteria bacterium]|nr:PAS domain S-box protein [Deltaproteobacteria bacterium]